MKPSPWVYEAVLLGFCVCLGTFFGVVFALMRMVERLATHSEERAQKMDRFQELMEDIERDPVLSPIRDKASYRVR